MKWSRIQAATLWVKLLPLYPMARKGGGVWQSPTPTERGPDGGYCACHQPVTGSGWLVRVGLPVRPRYKRVQNRCPRSGICMPPPAVGGGRRVVQHPQLALREDRRTQAAWPINTRPRDPVGPAGPGLVRADFLHENLQPPRGRGGAGWFQHPQLTLRDESASPSPWSAPPVPFPYDSRPPQVQSGQCGSPQAGLPWCFARKILRIFRFVGSAPPAQ